MLLINYILIKILFKLDLPKLVLLDNFNYMEFNADIIIFYTATLSVIFFGFLGVIFRRSSILLTFLSLELLFLGLSLSFIITSYFFHDWKGSIGFLLLAGIAAAESAIGLSFSIALYRTKGTLSLVDLKILHD